MKVTYDKQADAMYLYLSRGKVKKTIPVNSRVIVDMGEKGKIIGIELLFVSEKMSKKNLQPASIGLPIMAR